MSFIYKKIYLQTLNKKFFTDSIIKIIFLRVLVQD